VHEIHTVPSESQDLASAHPCGEHQTPCGRIWVAYWSGRCEVCEERLHLIAVPCLRFGASHLGEIHGAGRVPAQRLTASSVESTNPFGQGVLRDILTRWLIGPKSTD